MSSDDGLGERLTELLFTLCEFGCVTGEEGPIADWLAERYASGGDVVMRVGNSIIAAPPEEKGEKRPVIALVGHTDVVAPTPEDITPRIEEDRLIGRGSSDMLAGLAVLMDAFEDPLLRSGPYRLTLVAYAGEEGPADGNELADVLAAVPGLGDVALAIIGEPTNGEIELGCQGSIQAEVRFDGSQCHSSRPWIGRNAVTAAGEWLASFDGRAAEDINVDGLVYREVISPTQAWTENGRNVIPGTFTVNVNYRYAPSRTPSEAEEILCDVVGDVGAVTVVDHAPACPPNAGTPIITAFMDATGAEVRPKQAWTDVARFAAIGVPALNYGAGLTAQAHQRGEYVPLTNLTTTRNALGRFLAG